MRYDFTSLLLLTYIFIFGNLLGDDTPPYEEDVFDAVETPPVRIVYAL